MSMSESIKISARLDEVWPFVADPVGHVIWNEKVVDIRRDSDTTVQLGERFEMTYRMSGKDRESEVEVVVCDPPNEVHFRHQYRWKAQFHYAVEKYRLRQHGEQVKVTQEIDMSESGIPWFFRVLIWFLSRFGKPVGQTNMERLKEAVEESVGR